MSTDNAWAWWQAALEGNFGPMHEGEPQQGYYRTRFKGGQWEPVALWCENDEWHAMRGDRMVDPAEAWNFCRTNPVTYEAYQKAIEGAGWDDEPPIPTIGHNLPADPHEALKLEFEAEREQAVSFMKTPIASDDQADKAAIWSKRVAEIFKRADDMFREKKDPIVRAGKEVDEEFRWREEAKKLSAALKAHINPYLKEKQRIERERQEAARREEERLRREAEEAARKAAAPDQQSEAERQAAIDRARQLEQEAAAKAKEAEAKNASAGRTGARVSLRTFVEAKVNDYQAAATALVLMKHPDILAVIDQLAKRAVTAGQSLPGVERVETQRAA